MRRQSSPGPPRADYHPPAVLKLPAELVARLRPFYEGTHVVVTGGAGFIGSHLLDALMALGASVSVIDDLSNSTADHVGSLIDMDAARVRLVIGSILDDDAVADAFGIDPPPAPRSPSSRRPSLRLTTDAEPEANGTGVHAHGPRPKVVFHLAAMGSVPRSIAEPQRSWSVNATGTVRVLEAARRAGAKRVVFSASSSAYGDSEQLPRVETQLPSPLSPYAASKLAGEQAMTAWAKSFSLSTVSLRYFNVFGPRQSADSAYAAVVAAFAKAVLAGEAPVIFGDGRQSRDFTFVANVVMANLLAGALEQDLRGEVINIGTGRRTDLNELARVMTRLANEGSSSELPPPQPRHEPARAGDVRHSQADIAKARRLLGYEAWLGLDDGLRQTLAWYKATLAGA
jgi:nucleoside-diphosphate-sugar epimerase